MKISLKWLRDYVDIDLSPAELAERLTMAGLEVKGWQATGGNWEDIVVGQLVAIDPHPNADRLYLATVDIGTGRQTVVCGAPNLSTGDKVALARVGARLTDPYSGQEFRLKAAKIRGVASEGMVCSEKELGISDNHEGIMVLPADAPVGSPLGDYMGDVVLDLEVTPNRPDCLSVIGIAREVAALTGQTVRLPEAGYAETETAVDSQVAVEIADPDLCPRYCASVISGVRVAESPGWMQERLLACGMRPINNIVDVTNYVMLEWGEPLHAFSYDQVKGGQVIVRRARAGEVMVTLDGTSRTLTPDMLVIADRDEPVAVAGVMGGAASEVTDQTTTILLESASFNPASIYNTGSTLNLPSEARTRFERGISPELTLPALKRTTQLICQLGGGKAARGLVDVYPGRAEPKPILLDAGRVKRILGVEFSLEQMTGALGAAGFDCQPRDAASVWVSAPYWRSDIRLEEDVVEEVARIIGYDKIPMTMLSGPIPQHDAPPIVTLKREARRALVGFGFQEVVTYSLTSLEMLQRLTPEPAPVAPAFLRLANPMTAEQAYLRPSLRANLLLALAANQRHETGAIRLFELGRVYLPRPQELPEEPEFICGLLSGPRHDPSWHGDGGQVDLYDAKGVVEAWLDRLGVEARLEPGNDLSLHPGRQLAIVMDKACLGVVGGVHPKVARAFELSAEAYLFEINLAALLPFALQHRVYQPVPRFPQVVRDLALVLDDSITHGRVQGIIKGFALVSGVLLFDIYAGDPLPPGKKSLAYRLTFQSPDHTLTDDEVNKVVAQILARLSKDLGASLR